jgi:triphosphoribosyl-dephospho-CoA synthase
VVPVSGTLAHSTVNGDELQRQVLVACLLEVSADKPGNVTPRHDFPDMTFVDMVRSALALAPVFTAERVRAASVGELIADGVRATGAVTESNTNLGIVLLFAPLARAAVTRAGAESLRGALERVLAALDVADATAAFQAIVSAQPGGLGDAVEHDVREPARITLREAMAAAADRDSIASEYASGYSIVFESGLPLLIDALGDGASTLDAVVKLHVGLLATQPDTLIARKAGADAARAVSQAARAVRDGSRTVEQLDAELRRDGRRLNPGTTADLVAATLLAAQLTGVPLP